MTKNINSKKNNRLGSKIAFVLGLFLIASTITSGSTVSSATGTMMVFGSIAYTARREQIGMHSTLLLFTEIFSLLIILYTTLIGILSGDWYQNPIPFVIAPIWIVIVYVIAFRNRMTTDSNQSSGNDTEVKRQSFSNFEDLEKLYELKEKGVITIEDFDKKKKQNLRI